MVTFKYSEVLHDWFSSLVLPIQTRLCHSYQNTNSLQIFWYQTKLKKNVIKVSGIFAVSHRDFNSITLQNLSCISNVSFNRVSPIVEAASLISSIDLSFCITSCILTFEEKTSTDSFLRCDGRNWIESWKCSNINSLTFLFEISNPSSLSFIRSGISDTYIISFLRESSQTFPFSLEQSSLL